MRKAIVLAGTLVLSACSLARPTSAATASSPTTFYTSLAQAIDSADGNVYLEYNDGDYQSNVGGVGVLQWHFDHDTTGTVHFNYGAGKLNAAIIDFDKPVMLTLVTGGTGCLKVKHVEYLNGRVTRWDVLPCTNGAAIPSEVQQSKIKEHLRQSRDSEALLLGKPNENGVRIKPVTNPQTGETPPASMVKRVELQRDGTHPALKISFLPDHQIDFGQKLPDQTNTVTLGAPSTFELDSLAYNVATGYTYGKVLKVNLQIAEANFEAGKFKMHSTGGSLTGANIFFDSNFEDRGQAVVQCENGTLTANFDTGLVQLSKPDAGGFSLKIRPSTHITIDDYQLFIGDGTVTSIKFGGGTNGTIACSQGTLPIGQKGKLNLSDGVIEFADLNGEWQSGGQLRVLGVINSVDLKSDGAVFALNNDSEINLTALSVKGNTLALSSATRPILTGRFNTFVADFGRSNFAVPSGISLELQRGHIQADYVDLKANQVFPSSSFKLSDVAVGTFASSSLRRLTFSGGTMNGTFVTTFDGSVTTPYESGPGGIIFKPIDKISYTGGKAVYKVADEGAGLAMTVNLADGIIWPDLPTSQRRFTGQLSGNVDAFSYVFKTPERGCKRNEQQSEGFDLDNDGQNNDKARLYSFGGTITLDPNVPPQFQTFGPAELTIKGSSAEFALDIKPKFRLSFNDGAGEYREENFPEQGGTGKFPHYQEVFRDKYGTSTVHLYLGAQTYQLSPTLTLGSSAAGGFYTKLTHVELDRPITRTAGWDRDGGELLLKVAQFGAAFARIVSFGGFDYTGQVSDERIDGMIDDMIGRQIQSLGSRWSPAN